jgi:hypothetical protein
MLRLAGLGLVVAMLVGGCGRASLTDPVVARTGRADTNDGYQAALAAVHADGYEVVAGSQESGYLRVWSKSTSNDQAPRAIEISVWPGSIRLDAALAKGETASETDATLMRREMQELAWAIAGRARALAGEAAGPVTTRPYSNDGDRPWRVEPYPSSGGLQ